MKLNPPESWKIALILAVGILATSTAAILVRLAIAEANVSGAGFSLVLATSRLTLAAIALIPTWAHLYHSKPALSAFRYATFAGIALAVHFATWITSLSYTSIAASTTLVTTNSIWVALLSWWWFGEKPARLTLAGMTVALAGGALIGWGGKASASGSNPLLGDALALTGAWAASLYFLLGREAQRRGLGIGSYATVAYSVAAIALLPLPSLFGASYTGYTPLTYGYIALMALLPQLIGHTSLNWSLRWLSPILVTLSILFEPVASSVLGFLIFNEVPSLMVSVGAGVLLLGVAIATLPAKQPL